MNNYIKPCGIMEFKDGLDSFYVETIPECRIELEKPKTLWTSIFGDSNKSIDIISKSLTGIKKNIERFKLMEEDINIVKEDTFIQMQDHMGNMESTLSSLFPDAFKKPNNGNIIKKQLDWLNKYYISKEIGYEKFKEQLSDFRLLLEKKKEYYSLISSLKIKQNNVNDFVKQSLKVAAVLKKIVGLKSNISKYLNNPSNLIDPMIIENMKLNEIVDSYHMIIETEMKKWVGFISSCSQDAWRDAHVASYFKLIDGIPIEVQTESTKIYEFLKAQSEEVCSTLRKRMFECEYFKEKSSHLASSRILKIFLEKNWKDLPIKETPENETIRGLNKYLKEFQDGKFTQFEVDVCRNFNFSILENSKDFDSIPPIEDILKQDVDGIVDDNEITAIKSAKVLEIQLNRLQSAMKIEENNKWFFPILMILNQGTIISASGDLFALNPCIVNSIDVDFKHLALKLNVERPTVFKVNLVKDIGGIIQEIKISLPYSVYCYQGSEGSPPIIKNLIEGSVQFSLKLDSENLPYIENYIWERNWNSKSAFNG